MARYNFWQGKRVFLTGHTGFKGAWLSKILEMADAIVTGYALAPSKEPNLYDICKPEIYEAIGDIRDFDALFAAYKKAEPQVVIHMAAQPLVLQSYGEPRYTYETNVMGTVNLMECVRICGAKSVLNITTDKVYLGRECARGYREDDILDGHDPYSNSKSCSELVTASYIRSFFAEMKIPVSTARSGNVIGGGDFADNRLIPDCYRAVTEGESIKIRNPASVRPYQHVMDTLFAYLLIVKRQYEDISFASSYNIGPEESDCVTSGELAELFCGAWGKPARWEHIPTGDLHESELLKLDCSKIRNVLGWRPRWSIGQAVSNTVRWYKALGNGMANAVMVRQIEAFMEQTNEK